MTALAQPVERVVHGGRGLVMGHDLIDARPTGNQRAVDIENQSCRGLVHWPHPYPRAQGELFSAL